jgi:chemotaxis protein MotB
MARGGGHSPTIIIKRVKKVSGGHHGGAWKVAYADFVTAMMAFFMLLWLISNPDKIKLKELAQYFSPSIASGGGAGAAGSSSGAGHDKPGGGESKSATGQPSLEVGTIGSARGGTANVPDASMRVMAAELRVAIDSTPTTQGKQNLAVESSPEGVRVTLMDNDQQSMFRTGTAVLNDYAKGLIARVADKLGKSGAQISIEGHTDALGGDTDSNWRLSGDRALAARAELIARGIAPGRFNQVIAMGATRPVYPDQPNRPENRRITIIIEGQRSSLPSDVSFKF